ncbi:MAG: hypothetical protein EXS03_08015 [Phycisphaerales bacterium]|nr:hypothetical protein [Phycisphaerales bacterium]
MTTLVAYIPFLEPCGMFGVYYWVLVAPLVFGIAVVYRATHDATLAGFWSRTGLFTIKSTFAMGLLALGMYLFVYFVLPILPAS